MQEERRFLERVGAARDDDAGQLLVGGEDLVDPLGQAEPLLERQLAAGDVGELLVRERAKRSTPGIDLASSSAVSRPPSRLEIVPPVATKCTRGSGRCCGSGRGARRREVDERPGRAGPPPPGSRARGVHTPLIMYWLWPAWTRGRAICSALVQPHRASGRRTASATSASRAAAQSGRASGTADTAKPR